MGGIKKYLILLFLFLFTTFSSYTQEYDASIPIIYFNSSATYSPGSGVSVHIDPKGVYEIINTNGVISQNEIESSDSNSFLLELYDDEDNFIQVLSEVHDFYTPLINGDLPDVLPEGMYKLRIKATHAKIFNVFPNSVTDSENTESINSLFTQEFQVTNNIIVDNELYIQSACL